MLQMRKAQKLLKGIFIGSVFIFSLTVTALADNVGQVRTADAEILAVPSPDAEIVTGLSAGQPVRILGTTDSFYKISFDSNEAFVSHNDLTVVEADGVVNDVRVNVRDYPGKEGNVVGMVNTDEVYTARGVSGEWYMIDYGSGTAYIHRDYFSGSLLQSLNEEKPSPKAEVSAPPRENSSQENVFAVVTSDTGLNLRSSASTDGQVVKVLSNGTVMDVLDVGGEWLEVSYNGTVGYVNAEFISITTGEPPDVSSGRAEEIISYAKQFLGTPYKFAGTNLNSGVDCSGFVYSVMKHFGVSLNRSSRDMACNGTSVSKSQLAPGDLVFFDTNGGTNNGNISHVGIYIGNGNFIHSSSSQRTWGVVITNLSEEYYVRNYVSAVRVLS